MNISLPSLHIPFKGGYIYICSEGMLTHLFFPVRKFGLGSGQIQMLVV